MNKITNREGYVNVVLGAHYESESFVSEFPQNDVSRRAIDTFLGQCQEAARGQGYDFSELPDSVRESVLEELLEAYQGI